MGGKDLTVTRVTDQVYQIDVSLPNWPRTVAAYVLKGSKIAIVDCGYASTYETILQGLRDLGIQPSDISYLIPTHLHLDHSGGTRHMLRHAPNAQVIAHERAAPHLVDPRLLIRSASSVHGEEMMKIYGYPVPVDKNRIMTIVREMRIDLGEGLSVLIFYAPGHANHQISLFIEGEGRLLTGDAVGMILQKTATIIPSTPPPSFDLAKFVDTTDQMLKLNPRELLVPHYGVWKNAREILEESKSKTENCERPGTFSNSAFPSEPQL